MRRTVLKFVGVGLVTAATEYLLFAVLLVIGVGLLLANSLSFIVALGVSFALNGIVVFAGHKGYAWRPTKRLSLYGLLALCNLAISGLLVTLLVGGLGVVPLIAKAIAMVLIASYNFLLYRHAIFRHRSRPSA